MDPPPRRRRRKRLRGAPLGLAIFTATNWLVLKGGPVVVRLALLAQFCPGYSVSVGGSFVGFAYGVAYGAAAGFAVSRLYNRFVDLRRS